jgi:hypothetical protein
MAMPIVACLNQNFVVGTFMDMNRTREFALGAIFIAAELLTVYLVIGKSRYGNSVNRN